MAPLNSYTSFLTEKIGLSQDFWESLLLIAIGGISSVIIGFIVFLVRKHFFSPDDLTMEDLSQAQQYIGCKFYMHSDNSITWEPTPPKVDQTEPPYIILQITNVLEIVDSLNVSSVTDHGTGDYSINLIKAIQGNYWVQILSDTNYQYKITKHQSSFRIKFSKEPQEMIKILIHL
jgi:hypothetical protein